MTHLRTYLSENKITQEAFAATIGVTQATVSKLAARAIGPSLDLAIKIERATSGAVPVEAWQDPAQHVVRPSSDAPLSEAS